MYDVVNVCTYKIFDTFVWFKILTWRSTKWHWQLVYSYLCVAIERFDPVLACVHLVANIN